MNRAKYQQRFGKRRAPVYRTGPVGGPFGRWGALVSLPYSIGKVIVEIQLDPDRSLSLRPAGFTHCRENVSRTLPVTLMVPRMLVGRAVCRPPRTEPRPIPGARGYGSGRGRQGIARTGPCPLTSSALHLDCPDLRHWRPLGIGLRKSECPNLNHGRIQMR